MRLVGGLLALALLASCTGRTPAPVATPCGPSEPAAQGATIHRWCGQIVGQAPAHGEIAIQYLIVSGAASLRDALTSRPVVAYHPGGPGVSVVPLLLEGAPPIPVERFTVIAWDGLTSAQGPGSCGPVSTSFLRDRPTAGPALMEMAEAVARECLQLWAPTGVSVAVNELEQVRERLGLARIDLLGSSWGAAVAAEYAAHFPQRVRSVVLDAPFGSFSQTWWDGTRSTLPEQADALLRCAPGSGCPHRLARAFQGPGSPYASLREAIEERRPAVGPSKLALPMTMVDQAIIQALRTPNRGDALEDAIVAALGGDGAPLWKLGEAFIQGFDISSMYAALCPSVSPRAELTLPSEPPAGALMSFLAPCAFYPERTTRTSTRAAPTLVLSHPDDPFVPVETLGSWAGAATLALICPLPGHGHGTLRHSDGRRLAAGSLADPARYLDGTSADAASSGCLPSGS